MIGFLAAALFLVSVFAEQPPLPTHRTFEDNVDKIPVATGVERNIGDLLVYESKSENEARPKILLIAIYDLFGIQPPGKYISDRLTLNPLFKSVVPDFLRGKAYDPNITYTFTRADLNPLFFKNGSWEQNVKTDLRNVIDHYKGDGFTGFGLYSFCWGGKMSVYAASDPIFNDIKAIGLVHPSLVVTADAEDSKVPMLLLPSKDEPDMISFLDILNKNLGNKSEHKRFSAVGHGYAGGKINFSDAKVRDNVKEVINLLSEFFVKRLS